MNAAELRYKIVMFLSGLSMPAAVKGVEMISPVPGQPLAAEVTVVDPYTPGPSERRFRVTVEEITS